MPKDGSIVRPDWQTPDATPAGIIINAIQHTGLIRGGIQTVPETVDQDGLEVAIAGERWRIEIFRVDRRPCPTDGWPVFDRGNPLDNREAIRRQNAMEGLKRIYETED